MRIRLVQIEDYNQLHGLLRQLNPANPETTEVEYKVFKEIIESKSLDIIVAENEGNLLASCYVNLIPNMTRGGRPYVVVENVITDLAYRNGGIGKALITRALDLAWEENCYKVMLMSRGKDAAVKAFYKKCGFTSDEKQAHIHRAA
jgi:N-acetylglutamate synthase-like GNAT family acetyltransferase